MSVETLHTDRLVDSLIVIAHTLPPLLGVNLPLINCKPLSGSAKGKQSGSDIDDITSHRREI